MFDKYIFIDVDKLGEHEFLRLLLSIRCKIVVGFLFYGFNATNRGKHVIIHTWNMCRLDTKYACNHNLIPAHIHTLKWMRINHIWCVCVRANACNKCCVSNIRWAYISVSFAVNIRLIFLRFIVILLCCSSVATKRKPIASTASLCVLLFLS